MRINCDWTGCAHNNGNGSCDLESIHISRSESGDPICQEADFEESRTASDIRWTKMLESHMEECRHRIDTITKFMKTNSDANKNACRKNIDILNTVICAIQELRHYREIGTVDECAGYKACYEERRKTRYQFRGFPEGW